MFGDSSGDSERARRLEVEAETDRELKEGAPAKQSPLDRWRAWRQARHAGRSATTDRSRQNPKNDEPPSDQGSR